MTTVGYSPLSPNQYHNDFTTVAAPYSSRKPAYMGEESGTNSKSFSFGIFPLRNLNIFNRRSNAGTPPPEGQRQPLPEPKREGAQQKSDEREDIAKKEQKELDERKKKEADKRRNKKKGTQASAKKGSKKNKDNDADGNKTDKDDGPEESDKEGEGSGKNQRMDGTDGRQSKGGKADRAGQ